ncbi:MAG: DNA mismatch repair endonuclease MutL, partial [Desulfatitalea sp.]|nr:DNA mismatch repair endonuclease MutL [Desulfatitalea sp.]
MTRIRILPDILANKIAAGEVVERPAAVVKELVENALDAGSSRITIEIENGGRSLIQVADNGTGMGYDDALLALERFATSKLRTDADLAAIRTLGFRGEALPSIAAVSKLTLITREQASDTGVQIQVEGGRIVQVTETGAPRGTLVRVARIFYNTPARRKFLKTVNTEMAHIADTVSGMALGWPHVHFTLTHNGKAVKNWPRASDGAERAADVLGPAERRDLIPLDAGAGPAALAGWIAPPRLARNTARGTFLFVNGRRVRDRVIQHALFEGFQGRLMKGRYPLAVLLLTLPCDQVDVNVHPTKHEVRFVDPRRVHDLVRDGVRRALDAAERRRWHDVRGDDEIPSPRDMGGDRSDTVPDQATMEAVAEPPAAYGPAPSDTRPYPPPPGAPFDPETPVTPEEPPAHPPQPRPPEGQNGPPATAARPTQETLWHTERFAGLTVIGQYRGTYILCQEADDLILIDQHAAHERIVFETLGRRHHSPEAQRLLLPETVELGFA